jgi:guanylate kinase
MKGKLILFCGPSGSGKTTITRHLLENFPELSFSVSATTRHKRPNEIHGKDYYFLTVHEFKQKIATGEFVEWEEVYKDLFYGTLKSEIERIWKENKAVTFDVDVEGGLKIKKIFHDNLLAVFVKPLSVDVLRKRLTERNTESEQSLRVRIEKAVHELTYENRFDHVIVNDTLEHALEQANKLVSEFLKHEKVK